MKLRDELIKILVDKLLIGLILLAAGLYLNSRLEMLKTDLNSQLEVLKTNRSFSFEMNKIKVNKIADLWAELYRYEDIMIGVVRDIEGIQKRKFANKREQVKERERMRQRDLSSEKQYDKVRSLAYASRFWLGEERFRAASVYAKLWRTEREYARTQQTAKMEELQKERRKQKLSIDQIRDELIAENGNNNTATSSSTSHPPAPSGALQ